ncbi:MAG: hypothetical protein HY663_02225 [Chloroflexi bacterium]|nr:hypothetical protein [Chloroflexota bacterium]
MVLTLTQRPETKSSNGIAVSAFPDVQELVAHCPECKTLETLTFSNGRLMPTRKFFQIGNQVYHDCGSHQPCRLYRAWQNLP